MAFTSQIQKGPSALYDEEFMLERTRRPEFVRPSEEEKMRLQKVAHRAYMAEMGRRPQPKETYKAIERSEKQARKAERTGKGYLSGQGYLMPPQMGEGYPLRERKGGITPLALAIPVVTGLLAPAIKGLIEWSIKKGQMRRAKKYGKGMLESWNAIEQLFPELKDKDLQILRSKTGGEFWKSFLANLKESGAKILSKVLKPIAPKLAEKLASKYSETMGRGLFGPELWKLIKQGQVGRRGGACGGKLKIGELIMPVIRGQIEKVKELSEKTKDKLTELLEKHGQPILEKIFKKKQVKGGQFFSSLLETGKELLGQVDWKDIGTELAQTGFQLGSEAVKRRLERGLEKALSKTSPAMSESIKRQYEKGLDLIEKEATKKAEEWGRKFKGVAPVLGMEEEEEEEEYPKPSTPAPPSIAFGMGTRYGNYYISPELKKKTLKKKKAGKWTVKLEKE